MQKIYIRFLDALFTMLALFKKESIVINVIARKIFLKEFLELDSAETQTVFSVIQDLFPNFHKALIKNRI